MRNLEKENKELRKSIIIAQNAIRALRVELKELKEFIREELIRAKKD